MTQFPCANYRRKFKTDRCEYELNTTSRKVDSLTIAQKKDLIVRTTKLWLYIAKAIENGQRELPEAIAFKSAETPLEDELKTDLQQFGEPRVTIFDWNHQLELTLHSNSLPQPTLEEWWAMDDAQKELETLYPKNAPQSNAAPQNTSAPYNPATDAPATPKSQNPPVSPVEGAIVATRAPNSKRPDYANGQLVSFTVTKIVASSNKGSAIYQMWTPLGNQYPTITVYKFKPNSQDLKPDYEAIVPVLNQLNLSLDKPEAMGTWRLICRAVHVPNKENNADLEYLNVVSLTSI